MAEAIAAAQAEAQGWGAKAVAAAEAEAAAEASGNHALAGEHAAYLNQTVSPDVTSSEQCLVGLWYMQW